MTLKLVDATFDDLADMIGFVMSFALVEDRVKTVVGDILLSSHFELEDMSSGKVYTYTFPLGFMLFQKHIHPLLHGKRAYVDVSEHHRLKFVLGSDVE
jgi:hypothetical protein